MMEKPYLIDQERCTGCQICVRECPTNAVTVELDQTKPASARPKPVIIRRQRLADDGYWHPLSEYTKEYLKRPVSSMWSGIAGWKPMNEVRGTAQVWRGMKKPRAPETPTQQLEAPEARAEEA
jgi:ferredoxin